MKKYISGYEFINKLIDKGIVKEKHGIKRVTIDAVTDEPVVIFVEFYGDELLLEVGDVLDGAKFVVSSNEKN